MHQRTPKTSVDKHIAKPRVKINIPLLQIMINV